ncbi:bifunctional metallophosphatase/5'-nucleotidase [Jeotgalibacillus proteolyticus]|uniref:Bifunctional metallophosphatase/5'-nucleotidase n=1 Tax=Jeotgalibacillus proteolyticus TaxID=2082395 RepID=A0A2S5GAN0_9BACL|nr:bifunctional UDP-sugar hydrolase/5'-nucleotidase [Jeotgalibacillus proteolyticus]PPA70097.1 bifunctional metallophosphatase/5'-nucleotidase [Jeotgalibacillus proteolyticus]
MKERIYFYHTNDLHSHFENWPRIRDYLAAQKKQHKEKGEDVFLFDIGDHTDRWHPLTEGSKGRENIHLLNELGYDAVTIGNNEGITFSYEDLNHLYDDAKFPVVLANLFNSNGHRPDWVYPTYITQTAKGTKIGIVAVTAEYPAFYDRLGWIVTPARDELKAQVRVLKKKVDVVVFLSHLGIREDEWVAEECPEIDVIMGGHTHHILERGKIHNKTLITAAGKYGMFVGEIAIDFDHTTHTVSNRSANLIDTAALPASLNEEEEIKGWMESGKQLLSSVEASLTEDLPHDPFDSLSPLGSVLGDALLEWCDADCALLTGGLLLDSLTKGPVTAYELHRILPHPINPCTVYLNGSELKEVLREAQKKEWPATVVKGLGFRGTILGAFIYKNISWDNHHFYIQNEKIDPDRLYSVATVDMFTFGYFFPQMQRAKKEYFMPEFLRDILKNKLKEMQA